MYLDIVFFMTYTNHHIIFWNIQIVNNFKIIYDPDLVIGPNVQASFKHKWKRDYVYCITQLKYIKLYLLVNQMEYSTFLIIIFY